jgi:hypoxanthine phosphoribosyltransferase
VNEDIQRIIFGEGEIRLGLDRLAAEIAAAYRDCDLTVVAVLKGSCVFVADLIRRLPLPLELAFLGASSYRDDQESGRLELSCIPSEEEIRGRRVLLVDDILDTGRTLQALVHELAARGAQDVATCVFLDKPARRRTQIQADFVCFEVEDVFVVGYGLDFAGRYRNLPYVGALKPEAYASAPRPGRAASGAPRER